MDNTKKEVMITSVIGSAASLEGAMITASIPYISSQLSVSYLDSSLFLTLFAVISSLLFVPFYLVGEKRGIKKLLFLGALIFSLSGIAILITNSFTVALVLRSLQGLGASMMYPAQLAYASSHKGNEGRNIGFNYSMLALAYIIGVPLGYALGKIDWKYLFLLPSLMVFTSLFLTSHLSDLKGNFGNPRSAVGTMLLFNGVLISIYSFYIGIVTALAGLYSLSKWSLEKRFLKPLVAGFLHSLSRYAVVEFLVLSYTQLFHVEPLLAIILVLLFPLPMALISAPLGKVIGERSRTIAILGFSIMLLSWLLLFNKVIGTVILGIGTGIATVSNTVYTMQNLGLKDRVVGSAIKSLEGVVGISVGPTIAIALFNFKIGVELAVSILNAVAILLLLV